MESPIKKMLLNELIKGHEKELLLGGNLDNTNNNARKKKKIYDIRFSRNFSQLILFYFII